MWFVRKRHNKYFCSKVTGVLRRICELNCTDSSKGNTSWLKGAEDPENTECVNQKTSNTHAWLVMDIIGFRQCISIVVAIAILCHGFFHRFRSFLTDQPNCFAALLSMGLWNRAKGSALPTTHQVLASKILTRKLRETT